MPTATVQVRSLFSNHDAIADDLLQVILTQIYSGTGDAEHLSAFLLPQYAMMFLSTTAVTAYTLHILS